MQYRSVIEFELRESLRVKEAVIRSGVAALADMAEIVVAALNDGGKIVLCGNGGSAADAQHIAAEFVGRFRRKRRPLAAIALTTDSSLITAVGNDYGFEFIFARQVEALVTRHDVLIAISTGGGSSNVLEAVRAAQDRGARTLGLSGGDGGQLRALVELCYCVPSDNTARVQECHIALLHALCECVDAAFKKRSEDPPS